MDNLITITESYVAEIAEVHNLIPEFAGSEVDFSERIQGKTHLIIVAHHNGAPAGYSISYDKFNDGSLYCWMGVLLMINDATVFIRPLRITVKTLPEKRVLQNCA